MSEDRREALLPLRQDLSIHAAPPAADGSPQWTLSDPVTHTFYRIGWREFALLSQWSASLNAAELCAAVNAQHALALSVEDVAALQQFLLQNELLRISQPGWTQHLLERSRKRSGWGFSTVLQGYLFFRIPLWRPDRFLERTLPVARRLATVAFLRAYAACALLGLFLVLRQWDAFSNTFVDMLTLKGAVGYALTIVVVKIAHELGHAYTARHFGLRVPTMGVAFILAWPVLYTDTTDAWKLPSRTARLWITGAGMLVELVLAGIATLAWSFLPDGPLRAGAFMVASITWVMTLAVNLNPFMRFDGYYLMSDLLEVPNLQERAFALARWRLRRELLGIDDPAPEAFPDRLRDIVTWYGFSVWIYRASLFTGIALLLYHKVFAPLGPLLGAFEFGYFVALPVLHELRAWHGARERMRWTSRNRVVAPLLAVAALIMVVPWSAPVERVALLRPTAYAQVHAVEPAQVLEVLVREGDRVQAGQVLMRLHSPELAFSLAQAETEARTQGWQLERSRTVRELLDFGGVAEERYAKAMAESRSYAERIAELTVRAPFAGRVNELDETLQAGRWVTPAQTLLLVVADEQLVIESYVEEEQHAALTAGAAARFYPDDPTLPAMDATITVVDASGTRALREPWFADRNHGDITTRQDAQGNLVANQSIYRVLLQPERHDVPLARMTRGEVRLPGETSSFLLDVLRRVAAVLRRESGF